MVIKKGLDKSIEILLAVSYGINQSDMESHQGQ